MSRAVSVRTTPQRSWCLASILVAVLLTIGAHAAAAQSMADSTFYADLWTPKEEKFSLHIDGGLFTRDKINEPSPTVGVRLSKLVGSHLQVGALTGWTLERKDETERVSSLPGPRPELLLSRVDAHLVPLMGYVRVNLTEKFWLVPYVGAGAGYEWLTLEATDYRTQTTSTASFSNWAWQSWVGMGIRLGKDLRVGGEIFYNRATLNRDLVDENQAVWKELVNMDGVGVRVGIDIIFQ